MWKGPGFLEDSKNLALIGGAGLVGILATAGMGYAMFADNGVHVVETVHIVEHVSAPEMNFEIIEPLSGSNRLYGTVMTESGDALTGYLRWDKNEASWTDLLDGSKDLRRSTVQSGLRFGHIETLEPLDRRSALLTLRSGQQIELSGGSTDLGTSLRALVVADEWGSSSELTWKDIKKIIFENAPADDKPLEGRLYGTLTTRDGTEFTGTITWDVDEVYSTDVLDGDIGRQDYEIPFGAIARIDRESRRAARVTLHDGSEYVLDGSNDVNSSNRGIAVSDAGLGQVLVDWKDFASVRFHGADNEPSLDIFNGGRPIEGQLFTKAGGELAGMIAWDRDESQTWELLNGNDGDVEFAIEFGQIARITNMGDASEVELRDGRVFTLDGSNDVDDGNRGLEVTVDGKVQNVPWDQFRELRLKH